MTQHNIFKQLYSMIFILFAFPNVQALEASKGSSENFYYAFVDGQSYDVKKIGQYSYRPFVSDNDDLIESDNNILLFYFNSDDSFHENEMVLQLNHQHIHDFVYLSFDSNGQLIDRKNFINEINSLSRLLQFGQLTFDLNPTADKHFFEVTLTKQYWPKISLNSKKSFFTSNHKKTVILTLLYASLFVFMIINVMYYSYTKKTAYAAFAGYLFFTQLSIYTQPVLYSQVLMSVVSIVSYLFSHLMLCIFCYFYFQCNRVKDWNAKALIIWCAVIIVIILNTIIVAQINVHWLILLYEIYYHISLLMVAMIIFMNIKHIKITHNASHLITLAHGVLLLVIFVKVLSFHYVGVDAFLLNSVDVYYSGVFIQSLIIIWGLAHHVLSYKRSFDDANRKIAKTKQALFIETLITNFRFELNDLGADKNHNQDFIDAIENKWVNVLKKFADIKDIKRLLFRDQRMHLDSLVFDYESPYFSDFWIVYGQSLQHSCQSVHQFSQLVKSDDDEILFIALPVQLNQFYIKNDYMSVIFEMQKYVYLDMDKINDLQKFVDKTLTILSDYLQLRTVTSQAEQQQILVQEKEKTLRMKDRFFTNVSHELRTPLTLTIAPLKDLHNQREFLNTSGKYLVDTALSNAMDLKSLVDRFLDIQKLETETFPISISKVNMNQLIYAVINQLKNWSLDHNQVLKFNKNNKEDIYIYCDYREIKKVIINLVANAIKYSGDGSTIELSIEQDPDWIKVNIDDNGVGIDAKEHDLIFERYYQTQTKQHLQEPGTGIGLSYVKDVMHLHHGHIELMSSLDQGATFILFFKQGFRHYNYDDMISSEEKSSLKNEATPVKFDLHQIRDRSDDLDSIPSVLIVDDNNELREFLAYKLKNNYHVYLAKDGKQGLDKANYLKPDIIISDVMMPEMTGTEMMAHIRQTPELSTIPVILLTAKSTVEDTIKGLKIGADHYLTKPFEFEELDAIMKRLLFARNQMFEYAKLMAKNADKQVKSKFQEQLDVVILAHMKDNDLNVERLAELMFLDRSTLYRKIKKSLGMTPIAYIRKVRLDFAMELLKKKRLSVSEAAYACGFDSLSYFSKQFKKTHGTSPSDVL